MTRATFGGGAADFVYTTGPSRLLRLTDAVLTVWDDESAGDQITDLLLGGDPVETIPVGIDGQIPSFQGPDDVFALWVDAGGGTRSLLTAGTAEAAAAAAAAAADAEAAKEAAEAVGTTNDAIMTSVAADEDSDFAQQQASSYAAKRPAAPNIVIDSDSQGRGPLNSSAGAGLDLQTQVTAGIDPRATINNFAVGGQTVATMTADAVAQIDSLYSSSALANVVILWGGTNDIFFGASAATTYARIVAYHTARRAAGFKTVAVTLLPRSDAGTPVGYEAARISVNTSIRTNWATFADALADIAVDTRIGDSGDETDTAYYADLVHMTGRGYAIVADLIKRALSTLGIANAGPKTDTYASRINDFIVPARALGPVSGAPVQGMATLSSRDAWDLRDGFTDGVGAVVSIPEDWPRFSVSLLWATTTNTTNVVLRMDRQALGAGQNLLTGTNAGAATIVPCLAGYLLTETQLRNSVLDINVPSHRFWIQVLRLGTNGSDVNTEPVSVLGFLIKREIV